MAVPTSALRDRKAATRACYTASSSRRRAEPDATRARRRSDRMNPKYPAGPRMKSRVMKRSTLVDGHKTSVTLEDEFWTALKEIATTQNIGTPKLISMIDSQRQNNNLSSAIRVYVLSY